MGRRRKDTCDLGMPALRIVQLVCVGEGKGKGGHISWCERRVMDLLITLPC